MMASSNLTTFVRTECSNYVNGYCLGLDMFTNERFLDENSECLVVADKPCAFFVKCVLPLANNSISEDYRFIDKSIKKTTIKKCQCGAEIEKGKQLCANCRVKKRREAMRNEKRKQRGMAVLP